RARPAAARGQLARRRAGGDRRAGARRARSHGPARSGRAALSHAVGRRTPARPHRATAGTGPAGAAAGRTAGPSGPPPPVAGDGAFRRAGARRTHRADEPARAAVGLTLLRLRAFAV